MMSPMLLIAAMLQVVPLTTPPPASAPLPDSNAPPPSEDLCDEPVLMIVTEPTGNAARLQAYGAAIDRSELTRQLGGYALNTARPLATLAGPTLPGAAMLIVRFPCLVNAEAFWNSRMHREEILPQHQMPPGNPYMVTVFPEASPPEPMVGLVGDHGYRGSFDASAVPQHSAPR